MLTYEAFLIDPILSGSCTPCNDLEREVSLGRISAASAQEAVQKHYGGRVRSVREGASMETAHLTALDA